MMCAEECEDVIENLIPWILKLEIPIIKSYFPLRPPQLLGEGAKPFEDSHVWLSHWFNFAHEGNCRVIDGYRTADFQVRFLTNATPTCPALIPTL